MKKAFLLLILLSVSVAAQRTRAIYEYRFRPDSTRKDSVVKEWVFLDFDKNGSEFYSKKTFDSDSIVAESIKKQMASGTRSFSVSRSNSGRVGFKVKKTYPGFVTKLTNKIGNTTYNVLEDREFVWKILPEKKKIGEFMAQKAQTDFGGRQWTAWFTTEIPVQDGPYKFHGLLGLIVMVEDKTGSHTFELQGIRNNITTSDTKLNLPAAAASLADTSLEVSRKQYLKKLQEYRNDPVQGMRELLSRPNTKVKINVNGTEFSEPKDVLREMEKTARAEMAKNNNDIELKP